MNAEDFVGHQEHIGKPLVDAAQCGFNTKEDKEDELLGFATDLAALSERGFSKKDLDQLKEDLEANLYDIDELSIANALLENEDM